MNVYRTMVRLSLLLILSGCTLSADISDLSSLQPPNTQLKVDFPDAPAESQLSTNTFIINADSGQETVLVTCPADVLTVGVTAPASAIGTFNCVAGVASILFDTTALGEGANALVIEAPNNPSIASVSVPIEKDTLPPTGNLDVSISTYANKYRYTAFDISGMCSDIGGKVTISATSQVDATKFVRKSLTCDSSNLFISTLNLTTLPEGGVTIAAKHYDFAGNSVTDSFTRQKDITDADVPTLSYTPSATTSLTVYNTTVSGTDVVGYRYKIGLQSTTICSLDVGYSGATIPVATPISEDLTAFGNAPLRMCVLSVDVADNILNVVNALQVDWVRDTSVAEVLLGAYSPAGNLSNATGNRTVVASGDGITDYKYSVITSGTCATVDFSALSEVAIATPITVPANSDGTYQVCAIGKNLSGIWQTIPTNTPVLTIDTQRPSVTITSSTTASTNVSPIPVTVTFDEAVTGFIATDAVVTNGTLSGFTGSGTTYTFDVTPSGSGVSVTVSVAAGVAQDAATNTNTAAADLVRAYSTSRPTVVISSSTTSPTNASSFPVTVTFNRAVTGFVAGDVEVDNGSISNFAGSGDTYTFDVTKSGFITQGNINVRVPADVATDISGNGNTAAVMFSMYLDQVRPTVSVVAVSANNTSVSPVTFTATFDKAITGFIDTDLTVVNGVASITGTGPYTISVVPTGSGTVGVQVNATSVQDAAGNTNLAASSVVGVMYDVTAPSPPTVTNATYTTSGSSAPSASWPGASDGHSGIAKYEVAIGSSSGASDVKTWADVGTSTSETVSGLTLTLGNNYYVSVRVTDVAGNVSTPVSGAAFKYITTPTVSAVAPTSGSASGGTTITLTGTNFYGTMTVTVDGNPCSSVSVSTSTSLTCTTPAGSAGAKDVVVTNAASQSATLAGSFTYVASSSTVEFLFTGSDQNFVVPGGVTSIQIKAWGAGGTVTNADPNGSVGLGGAGAYAAGTLSVTPGETIKVIVGGQGGYGGGDGAGGGRSAIRRGTTELLTAGGGGGGGFTSTSNGGAGGDATSPAGNATADGVIGADAHGKGASPSAIGAIGTVSCNGATEYSPASGPAAQYTGGKNGGGGGYYGGGGGVGCGDFGGTYLRYGGGGGGSSYIGGVTSGTSTAGSGLTTGNAADPARTGSGAPQAGDSSREGLVVISY